MILKAMSDVVETVVMNEDSVPSELIKGAVTLCGIRRLLQIRKTEIIFFRSTFAGFDNTN